MSQKSESEISDAKPSREQIAIRAELLWKARGCPTGHDEEIWLQAERQLFDEAREIVGAAATPSSSEDPNPAAGPARSASEQMNSKRSALANGRRKSSGAR